MKASILIGVVLGLVILAAAIYVPSLFAGNQPAVQEAWQQEALARRQLARVSVSLPRAARLADLEAIDTADLDKAVELAQEELDALRRDSSQWVRQAEQAAAKHGLDRPEIQPFSVSTGRVNQAVSGMRQAVKENEQVLQQAMADARAARGASSDAVGVPQALGMGEYVKATLLKGEAHDLRLQQSQHLADLVGLATDWQLADAREQQMRQRQVDAGMDDLRADLAQFRSQRAAVNNRVGELEQLVAEREDEIARVEQDLAMAQARHLKLQTEGFVAGDDASFNQYRQAYLAVTRKLRELEGRLQRLRKGGLRGAQLVGADPLQADIRGGEIVVGLEELKSDLALQRETAQRLGDAVKALEDHITYVETTSAAVRQQLDELSTRKAELAAAQKSLFDETIAPLVEQAAAKEEEALRAAASAASAFGQAQTTATRWISDVRSAQSERDQPRKNPRLSMILGDDYLKLFGRSAQGTAELLGAQIQAQRLRATGALLETMDTVNRLSPSVEFAFDPAAAQERIAAAQQGGLQLSQSAQRNFESAAGAAPATTRWVPNASRAAAQHQAAFFDYPNAMAHLTAAAETIKEVVATREESPYLRQYVQLREHFKSMGLIQEEGELPPSDELPPVEPPTDDTSP